MAKSEQYFLTCTAQNPVTIEHINAAYREVAAVFDELRFIGAMIDSDGIRLQEGGRYVDIFDDKHTYSLGIVPDLLWKNLDAGVRGIRKINKKGEATFFNPNGEGGFAIETNGDGLDFFVRLFLLRLKAHTDVVVQDSLGTPYETSAFIVEPFMEEFAWFFGYKDILLSILESHGWVKGSSPYEASLRRARSAGTLKGLMAWN